MSGRGGGKGWYYKQKYGGGGRGKGGGSRENTGASEPAETAWPAEDLSQRYEGSCKQLEEALKWIDGKQYPAYKDIAGTYHYPNFDLLVDHIQGDSYAAPSRMRVRVAWATAGFPDALVSNKSRRVALCDYVTRAFWKFAHEGGLDQAAQGSGWSGPKGGDLNIECPKQHVLQRTSVVVVRPKYIEARCTINLPAAGRTILASRAIEILCRKLPTVVDRSLMYSALPERDLREHVESVEDQDALRGMLQKEGLVAFVRNGAILPRASGAADTPMSRNCAIPFESPPHLERTLSLPNRGPISGMGIPHGITVIVGGGFNGKSTLLQALEVGVYNHIPGDGREFVCLDPSGVKIRAEDGRRVSNVDISAFINHLPGGKSVASFTTEDASGSTSQAANILEALEAGARALLMDEDTCATNFMIRDQRMQMLVSKDKEPITPFLHRIASLYADHGISTVLVMGGSGDYFDVAHVVLMMDAFHPRDVTAEAKAIAAQHPYPAAATPPSSAGCFPRTRRIPKKASVPLDVKVSVRAQDTIQFGDVELDLSCVEQICERPQTNALADCVLVAARRLMGPGVDLPQILDQMEAEFDGDATGNGLDVLRGNKPFGHFARPRRQEIAAAFNRFRALQFEQQ